MRDARRAHPQQTSPCRHLASVVVHPARLFGSPDADGFYSVQSRRRWRRRAPRKTVKPVPKNLEGLCFNCLADDHVKADCSEEAKCFICRQPGHEARECRLGHCQGRSKRARSSPRRTVPRHSARFCDEHRCPWGVECAGDTASGRLVSTGRSPSVPPGCEPSPP